MSTKKDRKVDGFCRAIFYIDVLDCLGYAKGFITTCAHYSLETGKCTRPDSKVEKEADPS